MVLNYRYFVREIFLFSGLLGVAVLASTTLRAQEPAQIQIVANELADELNDDENCSLREAIQTANDLGDGVRDGNEIAACDPGDELNDVSPEITISLVAGQYNLSIVEPNRSDDGINALGDFFVLKNLVIEGAGREESVLDGMRQDRLFEVAPDISLTLRNLTIQNGTPRPSGQHIERGGGAILVRNDSALYIQNCAFRENETTIAQDIGRRETTGHGGAIVLGQRTSLVVENSIFQNNHASFPENNYVGDGDIRNENDIPGPSPFSDGQGGAIRLEQGTAEIRNTKFIGNRAQSGGAIQVHREGSIVTIVNSSFINNEATSSIPRNPGRAGVYSGTGTLKVERSILSGNTADNRASGFEFFSDEGTERELVFENNIFRQNGTIFPALPFFRMDSLRGDETVKVELRQNTFYENFGSIVQTQGQENAIPFEFYGNIISAGAGACDGPQDQIVSAGYNIVAEGSDCPVDLAMGDQQIPLNEFGVRVLGDFDEQASAYAFPKESIAIDFVEDCAPEDNATDYLGNLRRVGDACDAGAQELGPQISRLINPEDEDVIACLGFIKEDQLWRDYNFNEAFDEDEVDQVAYRCFVSEVLRTLLSIEPVNASDAQCALGGVLVRTFVDENANEQLDANEPITSEQLICDEAATEVRYERIAEGEDDRCPTGGFLITQGRDTDGDGIIDDIDREDLVCADENGLVGIPGQDGDNGEDGLAALVELEELELGHEACALGGIRVISFIEMDGEDGFSEGDQQVDVEVVCERAPNETQITEEPAGENCLQGGVLVQQGRDTDGDGVLDEIDQSDYICNGSDGAQGATGPQGDPGVDGTSGGCQISQTASSTGSMLVWMTMICFSILRRKKRRLSNLL